VAGVARGQRRDQRRGRASSARERTRVGRLLVVVRLTCGRAGGSGIGDRDVLCIVIRTGPAVGPVKYRTRASNGPIRLKYRPFNQTSKNRTNRTVFSETGEPGGSM
jgi:hypothetical protein